MYSKQIHNFTNPMRALFIQELKKQLSQPLPGAEAQQIMAPAHRLSTEHYLKTVKNYRKGSVLILLFEQEEQLHFVLTLRQSYDGIHSGQVSLPGGKIEESDANHLAAALRETEEEIGIPRTEIEILGELSELYIFPSNFMVKPVVGYLNAKPQFKKDDKEVAEVIVVATSDLLSEDVRQHKFMDLSRGLKAPDLTAVKVPFFNINGHHVWGATAMILSEFAEVTRPLLSQNI
jgi:8-oxo-dGTP pyrophosphatase MutT (NUDIX family)